MTDSNTSAVEPRQQQAAATAPAAPDVQSQLEQARAEIAGLKAEYGRETAERAAEVEKQRLDAVAAAAKAPLASLSTAEQEIAISKAIRAAGGLAFFTKLSLTERLAGIGCKADTATPDKVIKRFFGKGSDSAAATALARENSKEYMNLRGLARLKGIL